MGGGIGFVRDAKNNAKQNRSNLKKSAFKRTYKNKAKYADEWTFKEASPEELAAFKVDLLKKRKKERIIRLIVFLIFFSTLAFFVFA